MFFITPISANSTDPNFVVSSKTIFYEKSTVPLRILTPQTPTATTL